MPLKDFTILPFNYEDAICCAELVSRYHGALKIDGVTRDAVKDDFKIIAQAQKAEADFLITGPQFGWHFRGNGSQIQVEEKAASDPHPCHKGTGLAGGVGGVF